MGHRHKYSAFANNGKAVASTFIHKHHGVPLVGHDIDVAVILAEHVGNDFFLAEITISSNKLTDPFSNLFPVECYCYFFLANLSASGKADSSAIVIYIDETYRWCRTTSSIFFF